VGMGDEEEEEYDFQYSDDGEEEADIDVENTYYAAKGLKTDEPEAAMAEFARVSPIS
jgi:COP9 signalosome complex subunit 2